MNAGPTLGAAAAGLACALALSAGCGEPEQQMMMMPPPPPPLNERVVGAWVSATCESSSPVYLKREYTFTKTTFSVRADVFNDMCVTPEILLEAEGSYAVVGDSTAVTGASNIDITFVSRAVTARTQRAADQLNLFGCGGAMNWMPGERRDVSQTGCNPFAESVTACPKQHDIAKLDGERLQLGLATQDTCQASGRPTSLGLQFQRKP